MKKALKSFKEIWKAWFGIILIFVGLRIAIVHSDYWMLTLSVIGVFLFFMDRNKLKDNKPNMTIVLGTIISLAILFSDDILNHFF